MIMGEKACRRGVGPAAVESIRQLPQSRPIPLGLTGSHFFFLGSQRQFS